MSRCEQTHGYIGDKMPVEVEMTVRVSVRVLVVVELDETFDLPVHHVHMQPFCAVFHHAFTFCCELAKVRCENGRRNDSSRHYWLGLMKRIVGFL